MEKPTSSSSKDGNNKENINLNSVEVPKLGIEHMMRRKKGGCNLRKSLAWDRAFFTDEGILDSRELTLITGISASTCSGQLATISEEGNCSFSSNTRYTNESDDTQVYEESLLNELHDTSRASKGNREMAGCSVGHNDYLPHHKVTRKVFSIHRANRVGSKVGGCPEPSAASSLKRPANSNTMTTGKKEPKIPKLPMAKQGSCFSAMTKVSKTATQLRHTLIPKPTIKVQKNVGLKSSMQNVQGSQSKSKTGSGSLRFPAKQPAQKTVRNSTSSSSKATSSTKSRPVQVDGVNSGSKKIPDRLQLCEIQEGAAALSATNLAQDAATDLEIFTMKCGPVQHSPPDKSLPEPSPWSPVKKKGDQIGPYDCTKHINTMPQNSQ